MLDTTEKHSHVSKDKIRKLSYTETFHIGDLIRQHCKLIGKYAVYEDGWTDERITCEIGGTFTQSNVQGVRAQLIGPLRIARETKEADLRGRISALEERLTSLEDWATSRPKAPFASGE